MLPFPRQSSPNPPHDPASTAAVGGMKMKGVGGGDDHQFNANIHAPPPVVSTLPRKSFSSESQAGLLSAQNASGGGGGSGGRERNQSIASNASAGHVSASSTSAIGPAPLMYQSSSVKFQSLGRGEDNSVDNRHPSLGFSDGGGVVVPAVPQIPQTYQYMPAASTQPGGYPVPYTNNPYTYAYTTNGYNGYYGYQQQQQ